MGTIILFKKVANHQRIAYEVTELHINFHLRGLTCYLMDAQTLFTLFTSQKIIEYATTQKAPNQP